MTRHPAPSLQLLFHVALGATTAVALCASPGRAQSGSRTTPPDSSLVGRILMAEDRRDSLDAALVEGTHSVDPVVRSLAVRALRRITDPKFVARTSLSPLPAPPAYPEPAWRLRLRALAAVRDDCGALRLALADSAKPVRLRAADLVGASCAGDSIVIATLRGWVDALPSRPDGPTRTTVSWQAAAHALVALGRLSPAQARPRITRLGAHGSWHVRQYAARAAGGVADTALLRRLARDPDDNVAEAAIEQLARLVGHEADLLYLAALRRNGAQVVRAAAVALKDSPRADAAPAARAAFERFVAHDNASARDARVALLAAAGLPASADRPPMTRLSLSAAERADAVGLALGADVRLRVTLDAAAGGGSFTVRLRGDVAPLMGARLLALARRGYYDGLTWHRVEHDFVIQGGSPAASEYVGADRYLRDELGGVSHRRGTVGMSTRGHDTGDAQWFVNLRDNSRLDADYTVWAEVVDGIDVVDGILEGDRIARIEEVGARPR